MVNIEFIMNRNKSINEILLATSHTIIWPIKEVKAPPKYNKLPFLTILLITPLCIALTTSKIFSNYF
jgi:hypothetical protein